MPKFSKDEKELKDSPKTNSGDKSQKSRNFSRKNGKKSSHEGAGFKSKEYIIQDPLMNDPSWYAKDMESLDNIFKLPFSNRVGDPVDLGFPLNTKAMPGIMTFHYVPSLGRSVDLNSPLTRAANTIYAYIYQGYTSNPTFEAPDLLMYTVAVADLMANIAEAKRLYRTLFKMTHWNKYLGKPLYMALINDTTAQGGASYDAAVSSLANIRERLNLQMITIRDSFVLPGKFPLLDRWAYLASTILTDGIESKSQLYAYVKLADIMFDDTTYDTGTSLQLVPRKGTQYTTHGIFKLLDIIDLQIRNLSQNTAVNDMSGAIRRVYKDEGLYQVVDLVAGETLELHYNEVELHQIHNIEPIGFDNGSILYAGYEYLNPTNKETSMVPFSEDMTAAMPGYIRQGATGTIYTRPMYGVNTTKDSAITFPRTLRHIVDIHSDYPGSVDVAEATRGKAGFDSDLSLVPGTEIYITSMVYGFSIDDENSLQFNPISWFEVGVASDGKDYSRLRTSNASKFDWSPIFLIADVDTNGKYDITTPISIYGEINNYSLVDNHTLINMNERIFWQILNMPANIASVTSQKK